jgi:hypothetical protein
MGPVGLMGIVSWEFPLIGFLCNSKSGTQALMSTYRTILRASEEALEALTRHWPDLEIEACENADTFWVGGTPLNLDACNSNYRSGLQAFTNLANCLIALTDPNLSSVHSLGSLEVIDGETRHRICLVEPARLEYAGMPILVSARGSTRPTRPMHMRVVELLASDERFGQATLIFAGCGEDMRELFKVVELIEKAHGGLPKKSRIADRQEFFSHIEASADDWDALHRSFRPERHAEPHDMQGPTISPRLARILVHHTLKSWLARKVPE